MASDLKRSFSEENLIRSLNWIRTNKDGYYKNHFRNIYRAYSLAETELIKELRKRLLARVFEPSFCTRVYLNKKSGILRPVSLLTMEDQIVYQALVSHIAERLSKKITVVNRIKKKTFGHIYSGKASFKFYEDWMIGYEKFKRNFELAFHQGYVYTASFDLTACYDSINHDALRYYLNQYGLDQEFCDFLVELLEKWTGFEKQPQPIFHGHGIPQGPLSSGFLAEIILMEFDTALESEKGVRYFRYVDDIRLIAKDEETLRRCLVRLDFRSKLLGLFPQSSKIDIHKIVDIDKEIKTGVFTSHDEQNVAPFDFGGDLEATKEIKALLKGLKVGNESRVKFLLPRAKFDYSLQVTLIKVLERNPHLFRTILNSFSRLPNLSKKVSKSLFLLFQKQSLYLSYKSSVCDLLRDRVHPSVKAVFLKACRAEQKKETYRKDPELRSSINAVLLKYGNLVFNDVKAIVSGEKNWWVRQRNLKFINIQQIGLPSYKSLLLDVLKSKSADASLVATDRFLVSGLTLNTRSAPTINNLSQIIFRKEGQIKKVRRNGCVISMCMNRVLSIREEINWRTVLATDYDAVASKMLRWEAYFRSDPTAWVNLTDTINDLILEHLYKSDSTNIGSRGGSIGGILNQPTSRMARKYATYYSASKSIHDARLSSDLSHPRTKATGKYTGFVRYKEAKKLGRLFKDGVEEIWRLHFRGV